MTTRTAEDATLNILELLTASWVNKRVLANASEETLAWLEKHVGPDEVDYRRRLERELRPVDKELLCQPKPDDCHPAIWELYRLRATGAPINVVEEGLLLAHRAFGFDVGTLYEIFIDGGLHA